MQRSSAPTDTPPPARSFRIFVRDFAGGAGRLGRRAAAFTLLGQATEGIGLVLLLPLVNVLGNAGFGHGLIDRFARWVLSALPGATKVEQLVFLLGSFAALIAVRAWAIVNRDILLAQLQTGFVERLRVRVVSELASASWTSMNAMRHGRIAHVLSNDIRSCGLGAQLTLQSAVGALSLAVQIAIALLLSPAVTIIVLALLALGALSLRPALRRSRQLGSELTEASFRLTDDTNQFLGGLKLAFSQNLQDGFAREFRETIAYGATREVAFARQRSLGQVMLTTLAAAVAGLALLLGFGVFKTSPSALFALLVVLARMSGPAAQIQQNLQYVAHSLPAYEQIRALEADLTVARRTTSNVGSIATGPDPSVRHDVIFDHVSFSHSSDNVGGVEDISVALKAGSIVGITGASGAGKTTLLDLLVGLLAPTKGSIRIDEKPLVEAGVARWRDQLSYVSQDPYLFNDTIAGNLRWARADATDAEMQRALQLAGADTLVGSLPLGMETMVGERGTRLSGGERQRIALARAAIRNPALLILDEATNAIDVDGERAILQRLAALSPRPTIIMVAHRDQSLALCDQLLKLDGGRLAAVIGRPSPQV